MSVTLTSRHKNDLEIKKIFKKKIIIIYDNLCKTPQSDRVKSRVRNSPTLTKKTHSLRNFAIQRPRTILVLSARLGRITIQVLFSGPWRLEGYNPDGRSRTLALCFARGRSQIPRWHARELLGIIGVYSERAIAATAIGMLSIAVGSDLTQLACHVVNTVGEHGFLVQLFPRLFFLWLLGLGFLLWGFSWFDTVVLNGLEDT